MTPASVRAAHAAAVGRGGRGPHRRWSPDRFAGMEAERYLVTGKRGLRREVPVSRDLAARLESRRHCDAVTIRDRGIVYRQHYDSQELDRFRGDVFEICEQEIRAPKFPVQRSISNVRLWALRAPAQVDVEH